MSTAYAAFGRVCTLPPPAKGDVIAALMNIDEELPGQQQVDFFALLNPTAQLVIKELMLMGIASDYIGFGRVPAGFAIQQAAPRFWVFGRQIRLGACGEAALSRLGELGYFIPREKIRVVYGMPLGWHPKSTMEEVAPRIYKGCVVDDLRVVGIPITNVGERWAIWLGARIYGSTTSGEGFVGASPSR